ncbi:sensor histidine kinase [Parabacteroides distasonis]|uniref:sensor histidine kinase n=2 Tax=Parabacteroides distasonis TaxID=823 RepID=UPI00189EE368|nr:ATP-binding protein [Parabacteroides distasonis]MDB9153605.1 ATP-binding protein [Parabacteroides distasonis]MDB9158176.1 ATP-binding protein [Parabacteroides distasonis]MDB9166990.1 ATP-binding protein [Parabacteroides distasonis]MDB9171461.1 ATP-binding protein [Parabacteroides distasonis]
MVKIDGEKRHRIPFSQRLFWSVFFMFLGFTVCFLLFQYQREREFAQEKLNNVLSNYNYQLFRKCQQSTDINKTVISFMDDIPQKDLRVTIIDPSGDVLFDNSGTDEFNNHNDRSEVRKARLYNEGFAIRSSESTGKRYFYSASNIGGYIYRSALPYDPYVRGILTVNKDFIYFMALMTLIFFFVLSRFTFSIGKTISKLRDFALNVEKDRMPAVDYVFPNDELGDISQNIVTLYHRQQKAKNELSMEREKLIKHFQYSKEGFAMFTSEGREILSNILFIQFINVISDTQIHQVEDVTDIAELEPIRTFLNKNIRNLNRKKKVLRESVTIDKNGKIFLIECILFLDNSYEISINDISRQEEESRMKRQLTQNVSHELKTPVSSIQGYLETILSNPDLSPDKRQFFLERCYSQSTRLTGLLRDISVLNRLDEASEMFDLTEVNITKLIAEIQKECSKDMEEKHITSEIILPGDPTVFGNNSLLYSIFRNLYDNAIAYAGENIKITVNCYKEDPKYYYFSFSDNGVGIPEEHINRIFERFYRVDKGRSRKIGGTGLGLSIVKNGVNFHKGQISAKSSPGKGVTFFFTLKKKL